MKPRNSAGKIRYQCRRERGTGSYIAKGCLYAISLVLLCSDVALSQELSIKATADRTHIYIGESFNLTIEVSGSNSRNEPDLSNLDDCDIRLLGSVDQSRRSISIINGKMTQESYAGRAFTYKITPENTGVFKTGTITLRHDNMTISTRGPNLKVSGIEKQDFVLVSVTSSKESVLIDETFEITLSIRMKRLPAQYAHYDPIDPSRPPAIEIPYLKEEIDGLKQPDLRDILQKRLVRHPSRAGFSINNIELRDKWDFSFFSQFRESNLAKFALDRRDISVNGTDYYEYSFKLKYTALEEMNHTFGPVVFKGQVITSVDQGGNGSGKPIFAIGPACTVRVVPPPEENRPESYIGAVGEDFFADAELDTQTCNLGDPIKLTLALSGNVRLSNIDPPELSRNKSLASMFKIYSDTIRSETEDKIKKYIYTVRPVKSGTLEVPPIAVSYYDTKANRYKTIYTKAIPLRVNEAVKVSENFIIDTDTNRTNRAEGNMPHSSKLIAPLAVTETGYIADGISLNYWQKPLLVIPPAIYIISIMTSGLLAKRKLSSESRQQRRDLRSAHVMLNKALKHAHSGDTADSNALLFNGLRRYISSLHNKPAEGLTPNDVRNLLAKSNLPDEEAATLSSIYENIFNSSYSSKTSGNSITIEDIKFVIHTLDKLKHK